MGNIGTKQTCNLADLVVNYIKQDTLGVTSEVSIKQLPLPIGHIRPIIINEYYGFLGTAV